MKKLSQKVIIWDPGLKTVGGLKNLKKVEKNVKFAVFGLGRGFDGFGLRGQIRGLGPVRSVFFEVLSF